MLIETDINELGDKRLNPEEGLAKIKEENLALRAKDKLKGQAQLEDFDAARGQVLPWQEVLRLVKRLNPAIVARDGCVEGKPTIALYTERPDEEKPGEKKLQYVTGFYKEPLMEYSAVTVDDHGVALKEVRGWRTVLLALLKVKAFTFADVIRVFGDAVGQRSNRWHEQLKGRK